jgi:hypothetical protein
MLKKQLKAIDRFVAIRVLAVLAFLNVGDARHVQRMAQRGEIDVDSLINILIVLMVFGAVIGLIFTQLDNAANATGADASMADLNTISKVLLGLIPVFLVLAAIRARGYLRGRK